MAHGIIDCALEQELREVAQAVVKPLWKGLCSFNSVTEMLLDVEADIVHPESRTFLEIREEIVSMQEHIEKSEQIAHNELRKLDGASERLLLEQSQLATQKKRKVSELQSLNTELKSHRSNLSNYKDSLETHESNLEEAEETLESLRLKKANAEATRNAGIGLLFIPFVGWIVGATLIAVGQTEMDQASDAVKTAQEEVKTCKSRVSTYEDKVSACRAQITRAQCDVTATDGHIEEAMHRLRDLSTRRRAVARVQGETRKAVHQLGQLCAAGSVAELQTRYMILMEPVMTVMEEMTTALGRIAGNQLLHREGIHSLMWKLKTNQSKLEKLHSSRESGDHDYY